MVAVDSETLVRRYYEEVWEKGNLAAVDELVSPNMIDHNPIPGQGPGIEGHNQAVLLARQGFPDVRFSFEDVFAKGDRVVARWIMRGTHTGNLLGIPPTGKRVAVQGVKIIRVEDGKAAEAWQNVEMFELLQQLGLVPSWELILSAPGRAVMWLAVKRRLTGACVAVATLAIVVMTRRRKAAA
jgi:steroid delta-isomerase-like uncharacterized protein